MFFTPRHRNGRSVLPRVVITEPLIRQRADTVFGASNPATSTKGSRVHVHLRRPSCILCAFQRAFTSNTIRDRARAWDRFKNVHEDLLEFWTRQSVVCWSVVVHGHHVSYIVITMIWCACRAVGTITGWVLRVYEFHNIRRTLQTRRPTSRDRSVFLRPRMWATSCSRGARFVHTTYYCASGVGASIISIAVRKIDWNDVKAETVQMRLIIHCSLRLWLETLKKI